MLKTISCCLLFTTLILLSSCTKHDSTTLRLGTNVWPGYEPLYLAREKELLDDRKVHLVEYSNNSQVIQAYRNGLIDAAALTLDEVLLLLESGESPKILFVMDISAGGDAIIGQENIATLADMRNKKIGVEGSALGAYILTRALDLSNLEKNSISVVQMSVDQHEKAFHEKQVDAVVTFEPVSSKLRDSGGRILFDSRQIPGEIVDVLIIRKEFLKQHGDIADYLSMAWYKTLELVKTEPNESAKILGKRMQLNTKQTIDAYKGLVLPNFEENQRLIGSDPQLLISADRMSKLMFGQGLLNKELNVSILFRDK